MRKILLVVNHGYLFFGTTLYVGVLWALRFFWYPSWEVITVDTVQAHFIGPTSAATRFFTIVVPLMFLAGLVLVVTERKSKLVWVAVLALACIIGATIVGQMFIIPVNKTIGAGTDPAGLTQLLRRWMALNDIRFVIMTIMWLDLMYYFVAKGRLLEALGGGDRRGPP